MTTITFDTHKFVRRLREAGFEEKQAEAVTEAFKDANVELAEASAATQASSDLATKLDLKELELRLELKIAENNTLIEKTKSDLSRLYVSLVLLQTTLITGILLKVAHLI